MRIPQEELGEDIFEIFMVLEHGIDFIWGREEIEKWTPESLRRIRGHVAWETKHRFVQNSYRSYEAPEGYRRV